MKTKILLTHLFFYIFITSFSQAYIPFVKEGKMWTHACAASSDSTHYIAITSHKMEGDTLINSKLYKKVIGNYSYLNCLIYEDTVQKKVYCLSQGDPEFLLYDFDVQVGDTVWYDIDYYCYIVVDNITTVFLAGKYRKRIESEYGMEIWYEGLGGLINVFSQKCLTGGIAKLVCYFEDDTLLYHNPSLVYDCFNLTNTIETENNTITSNFANNVLNINSGNSNKYAVYIYDLFGKIIVVKVFNKELTLDLSTLAKGMYIYSIRSNELNYSINKKILLE